MPESLGEMSYRFGSMNSLCLTDVFSFLLSTLILTFPLSFVTGIIGAYQSENSENCSIIPFANHRFNSYCTIGNKGKGVRRAVVTLYGAGPFFNSISTGPQSIKVIENQ